MGTLNKLLAPELLKPNSYWTLLVDVNGYEDSYSKTLATQAWAGRCFQFIKADGQRLLVKLLEDGYLCWLDSEAVFAKAKQRGKWIPLILSESEIEERIFAVLEWTRNAEKQSNIYKWGGTIGPDLDCSGLIQIAFANQGIWIPRDAFQQEQFCKNVEVSLNNIKLLRPGDLIFFGEEIKCTHVGIYIGNGLYRHSSGKEHGRNGIGIDSLNSQGGGPVSSYYRKILRGAGRVVRCCLGSDA